jgi:deoxyhypusine synthase
MVCPFSSARPATAPIRWACLPLRINSELHGGEFGFEYDTLGDVLEACAYHFWGLFTNPVKELGILIMGGGVPKNFALQPEPSLLQNFMLDSGKHTVRGYNMICKSPPRRCPTAA